MASKFKNFTNQLVHAWNAFTGADQVRGSIDYGYGSSYAYRPDRTRFRAGGEKSIIGSIYNRIGIDVAANKIRHVRLDDNDQFQEIIKSGLNDCLSVEANIDQTGRAFIQDVAMTMFDEGVVAIVPIDTDVNPLPITGGYDIRSLRVGKITQWYPRHVKVDVYDDRPNEGGRHRELVFPKDSVAIVENPLYSVMNEPNSNLQRLIRKLNILDAVDEQSGSGKLDIIIQLPYTIRTEVKREQAEQRRKDIEMQLAGSRYGIAYTDGTERITQLNRPSENNLLKQVEYLQNLLYGQLGLTQSVFDGTADEATMLNYYNRTLEPILGAIVGALKRVFLTKTARSQGQSIEFYRDPFKLVPVSQLAEIADKFTRNEILTSNEVRGIIGFRPSTDAKADQLVNSNIPQKTDQLAPQPTTSL